MWKKKNRLLAISELNQKKKKGFGIRQIIKKKKKGKKKEKKEKCSMEVSLSK